MKKALAFLVAATPIVVAASANADLLTNGSLDATYQQEITTGFFLPKPASWVNDGTRAITGPYEDEMSSETWAGPAPTPVTTGGANSDDWGVFMKPFGGDATNGAATAHLYQDVAGTAGVTYQLTGWAGAEANMMAADVQFAIDFLDASQTPISSATLSLLPTLKTANGQAFNYKQYSVTGTAPAGTAFVRASAWMIAGVPNPAGGGQALVFDDFSLNTVVPEPSSLALIGAAGLFLRRRSK